MTEINKTGEFLCPREMDDLKHLSILRWSRFDYRCHRMESRNANSAQNCVKCCRKRATAMRVLKSRFWRRWQWTTCTATFVLSTYEGEGVDLIRSTTSPKNVGKLQINPPMILAGKWANYAHCNTKVATKSKSTSWTLYLEKGAFSTQGMPTMCQMELKTTW
jgi:hypothetical protein